MPIDSVFLSAVREELCAALTGRKVDKIQQPERDEIVLTMGGAGGAKKLLICAGTGDGRVHLTDFAFENPAQPPMFCMLLRKHLTGARLKDITQPPMERLLDMTFLGCDAMGDETEKHLIVELLGRFSNIILTDADGVIIDCLRRVDGAMSQERQVLPALRYRLPPGQGKLDIHALTWEKTQELMDSANRDVKADKWLLDTVGGLSPLVCRELVTLCVGDCDRRLSELSEQDRKGLYQRLCMLAERMDSGRYEPYMLTDESGKPKDLSYMPISQYGGLYGLTKLNSFSELLSEFYTRRDRAERMRQRSAALTKNVKNHRDRTAKKLAAQSQELEKTRSRERLRQYGDLINANLYSIKKGQKELVTTDYYSPQQEQCRIPLDPMKTPQQNAAKYYKDYTKARNAEKYLTRQIELGSRELEYLDSVLEEIARAEGEHDLSEIRQELTDTGYIKKQKQGRKDSRSQSSPRCYISGSGFEIRVGRNNVQNDTLTTKMSEKSDIWLHTQKIHGSHVVISCVGRQPDEQTLLEAATLAAYYSQARDSHNVPVDYTLVKYVKKPSGAKPGMVTYTNYRTVYVSPDESAVKNIREKK